MSKPIRILHVAHGIPSYHNSLIEMASRLRQAGMEMVVASHNDLSALLPTPQHRFVQLVSDTELEQQRQIDLARANRRNSLAGKIHRLRQSLRYRQRSLHCRELLDLVEHNKPDLLLIDMECHKAIVQAHTQTIPIVLLSRWYTVFRTEGVPPMHTLLKPAQNLSDALRIRWSWIKLRLYKFKLSMKQHTSVNRLRSVTFASNSRCDINALAKAHGLKLSHIADTSHWLIPHVYAKLPVISLTIDALEFGQTKDSRMHYAGAMVGAQDTTHPAYQTGLQLLQAFLQKRKASGNTLIYCSLSTFWTASTDITSSIIKLFTRRSDLDLVIGLGGKQTMDQMPEVPDNILALNYAPQLEVLKHADVAISHGGVSTINEAMVNGVPLIVCSTGHVDQNGCTARVTHHQVGLSCFSEPLDSAELETAIDKILSAEGTVIRKNIAEIQALQKQLDEKNTFVQIVKDLA